MDAHAEYLALSPKDRINQIGHRAFVGGNDAETWYGIGLLQFHFLISRGLRPHHVFLDVACGCLRLGQYLIPFLDFGNYFGLEAEKYLVRLGLQKELRFDIAEKKQPTLGHGYDFDLTFAKSFDFAIAQSLFTHLTLEDITACLRSMRTKAQKDCEFYFTFFEGDSKDNPDCSHANKDWRYSFAELQVAATNSCWVLEYIGDWQHPREQKMVLARPSC
jgi:hypothetical protein